MSDIDTTVETLGTPVKTGETLVTMLAEARALIGELAARRQFDEEVAAFLKEYDLRADFEAFRAARNKSPESDVTRPV